MKHARRPTIASLCATLMCASLSAGAQVQHGADPAASGAAAMTPASSGGAAMTPAERHDWERAHRVSKMVGSEVHDKAGETVGDIRDLVVDDHGRIVLAIVSTGGLLGVGDRLHAVPWEALTLGPKDDRVLNIDKAHLKDAPGFTSKTWPNLGDDRWMADNRRFYIH